MTSSSSLLSFPRLGPSTNRSRLLDPVSLPPDDVDTTKRDPVEVVPPEGPGAKRDELPELPVEREPGRKGFPPKHSHTETRIFLITVHNLTQRYAMSPYSKK